MTVVELRDFLVTYCARHPEAAAEQVVVVPTQNDGVPCSRVSEVLTVGGGSDWTATWFFVRTKDALLVERRESRSLDELAVERLASLEAAHVQLGSQYVAKARREAWILGFKEGVRLHITNLEGKE